MPEPATDGLLLVDKPAGMTSHDAVAIVRRERGRVRTGHTGTLDPFATGLLLVTCGNATRLARYIAGDPKVYRATIAFGVATDTDDVSGQVIREAAVPEQQEVIDAIGKLTGRILQVPPSHSAKQKAGRRAYDLARRGIDPELDPVPVQVHRWNVLEWRPPSLLAEISCGSGTYIRALARDLGELCSSAAHLTVLRRTRIGPFSVTEACDPAAAASAPLISPADAVGGLPKQMLSPIEAAGLRHGRSVPANVDGSMAALVDAEGALVAVAERRDHVWQPKVVLHAA